jgi:hypothetical protein
MRSEVVRIIVTIKAMHGIAKIVENQKVVRKLKIHTLLSWEKKI